MARIHAVLRGHIVRLFCREASEVADASMDLLVGVHVDVQ
jgi:hypothetical protein